MWAKFAEMIAQLVFEKLLELLKNDLETGSLAKGIEKTLESSSEVKNV